MAEKAEKLKEIWDDYISNAGKAASSFARSSKQYAEGVKKFVNEINAKASFTDEDKNLIDRICFTAKNNNPIAAKGRAACPDHEDIIKEKDFLDVLNNFKATPNYDNFESFQKKWESYIKEGTSKCPILVNRAAVAMDDNLCVLVNYLRLKEVGEWLQEKEFIEKINEKPKKENWYKFNVELMAHIKKSISFDEAKLEEKYMLKVFPWYLYEHYVHPKPIKKQEIRYGAPGTGKTYGVKEDVKTHFELWASQYEGIDNINVEFEDHFKLVQFHPSYTY